MATPQPLISSFKSRFEMYKTMGDRTFEQLQTTDFFYRPTAESNSIAIIIQHMYGNLMSRFTNFLTEDGEKAWRRRDAEFEPMDCSTEDLLSFWKAGWQQLFNTLDQLTDADLQRTVHIRSEPLTVFDALLRQLAHHASHVGQLAYIGKMIKNNQWKTLSIAKNPATANAQN